LQGFAKFPYSRLESWHIGYRAVCKPVQIETTQIEVEDFSCRNKLSYHRETARRLRKMNNEH